MYVDRDGMLDRYYIKSNGENGWIVWSKTYSYKVIENLLEKTPFGSTMTDFDDSFGPGETTWKDVSQSFVWDALSYVGGKHVVHEVSSTLLTWKTIGYFADLATVAVQSFSGKEQDAIGLRMLAYVFSGNGEQTVASFGGKLGEFENFREELILQNVDANALHDTLTAIDAVLRTGRVPQGSVYEDAWNYALIELGL